MRRSATAIAWLQRVILVGTAVALISFGMKATGQAVVNVAVRTGSLWLSSPTTSSVVQANPTALEPMASVNVSARLGDLLEVVQAGASAVVLNRSLSDVSLVDGVSLTSKEHRTLSSAGADVSLIGGRKGEVYMHDAAKGELSRIDTGDLNVLARRQIEPGATSLAVDDSGALNAFERSTGAVITLGADGSTARTIVTKPNSEAALTQVAGRPYVIDAGRGQILSFDKKATKPVGRTCSADSTIDGVFWAGSDSGATNPSVFALHGSNGVLYSSNLSNGRCVPLQLASTDDNPPVYGQPVVLGDLVFVPVQSKGLVYIVDAVRNRVERTVELKSTRFELLVADSRVWWNDLSGPGAGTLDRNGITWTLDKYKSRGGKTVEGIGRGDGESTAGAAGVTGQGSTGQPSGATDPQLPTTSTTAKPNLGSSDVSPSTTSGRPATSTRLPSVADTKFEAVRQPAGADDRTSASPQPSISTAGAQTGSTTNGFSGSTSGTNGLANPVVAQPSSPNQPPLPADPPRATLVARMGLSGNATEAGQSLTFLDRSTGDPISWVWEFGDGSTDTRQNVSHTFTKADKFVVTSNAA